MFYVCIIFVSLLTCVLVWPSLDLSCLRLSMLPGLGWQFPFPCQGSFQLLSLQIFSQVLSLSLLLGPYNVNIILLDDVTNIPEDIFTFLNSFLFCCLDGFYCYLLACLFVPLPHPISCCVFFCSIVTSLWYFLMFSLC